MYFYRPGGRPPGTARLGSRQRGRHLGLGFRWLGVGRELPHDEGESSRIELLNEIADRHYRRRLVPHERFRGLVREYPFLDFQLEAHCGRARKLGALGNKLSMIFRSAAARAVANRALKPGQFWLLRGGDLQTR